MRQATVQLQNWDRVEKNLIQGFAAAIFAFVTILAAEVRIPLPLTPIPVTLQTFVVPLAGGFLGAFWGTASMIIYLLLGIAGLNVFASAATGFAFFAAPSAGYVIGFILCSLIVGAVQDRTNKNSWLLLALIASSAVILLSGAAGLMLNAGMNVSEAFAKGIAPFLIGDAFKLAASFVALASYNHVARTPRPQRF
jgi:biotin transport system substrate-specific component